ncbi:MAG: hypothetical protein GY716_20980 [bacterium]|nr:hypothetical protein [bacterium]
MLNDLPWAWISILAATCIPMALLSSLVGLRQKLEMPLWWGLYAIWIAVVLMLDIGAPFRTILIASTVGGVLHGITQGVLIDRYIENNPWYADQMQGPKPRMRMMFVVMGLGIGLVFGAIMGGIAWGLDRYLT